jgi:hypothetical protein
MAKSKGKEAAPAGAAGDKSKDRSSKRPDSESATSPNGKRSRGAAGSAGSAAEDARSEALAEQRNCPKLLRLPLPLLHLHHAQSDESEQIVPPQPTARTHSRRTRSSGRPCQGDGYLRVCAHFQSGHPQHRHSRNLQVFKAVGGLRGDSCRLFSLLRCW